MNLIYIIFSFFLASSVALTSLFDSSRIRSSGSISTETRYSEGADEGIRQADIFYNDSVFLAVRSGDARLMRDLIRRGADINIRDDRGWSPLDYARKNNRKEIRDILQAAGALTFPKPIPAMKDGPHVRVIDTSGAEIYYLVHDTTSGRSLILRDTVLFSDMPVLVNGVSVSPADFGINGACAEPITDFKTGGQIFVVGDMHGEYSRTADMLRTNGIIDENGDWAWGKGHLVFVGDIFDRGSEVMEALWMIYRLEKQAVLSGGMVHMVLGNHEPMIFNNDLRYVTGDYYSLCDNLHLNYSDLFDYKSLLGFWLRQKPVGIRINNYLFVHAGFSPEFIRREVGLDSVNRLVWRYMNGKENPADTELRQFILGGSGVLWYRGLVDEDPSWDVIDSESLAECLEFYDCDALVIGHTEVDSIKYFFDGRVIDVNIPKRKMNISEQGLLIKGRNLKIIYQDGTARRLIRVKKFNRQDWN
ncbi:MAG: metallophosphoesterase [Bacteroidales bacterium]|jgi:hypothetical protein|nr:metallophosphoesterase [Bacteroidales bacterium]